jgi:hypothetical protein
MQRLRHKLIKCVCRVRVVKIALTGMAAIIYRCRASRGGSDSQCRILQPPEKIETSKRCTNLIEHALPVCHLFYSIQFDSVQFSSKQAGVREFHLAWAWATKWSTGSSHSISVKSKLSSASLVILTYKGPPASSKPLPRSERPNFYFISWLLLLLLLRSRSPSPSQVQSLQKPMTTHSTSTTDLGSSDPRSPTSTPTCGPTTQRHTRSAGTTGR